MSEPREADNDDMSSSGLSEERERFWEVMNEALQEEEEFFEAEDEDEEDEEDMDFEPDDEEDEDDHEFADAEESLEVEIDLLADMANSRGANQQGAAARTPIFISREQILQLLGQAGLRQILRSTHRRASYSDESESEADTGYGGVGPKKKKGRGRELFQKVPSEEGRTLMETGLFGTNERREDTLKRKKRLAAQIMRRELGLGSNGRQRNTDKLISQGLIPQSKADMIIHYDARCYSGQFSRDGNFFFSCAQDFKVRMYDTSNPYKWKYYKTVDYPYGQWTITDASLSSDNRFLAYSSIRSIVCLASTDPADDSEPHLLDFTNSRGVGDQRRRFASYPYFGIWSLRFSGDGREIVAGTGDSSVYVYDIESGQSILRITGHSNDVNAVCYGDSNSPHILYSGSDDTTVKIWDRRSLGDGREAGVFLGHTEGITYVDSKGDGRYVLSNGKDQTAKLWDLRRMMPKEDADRVDVDAFTTGFEYRNMPYDDRSYKPHPHDSSLVTFRGHRVLKTLIRCHFSPPSSTDSRYVYSGSQDGKVVVWNLDATKAGEIDVLAATKNSRPRDPDVLAEPYDFVGRNGNTWQTCVRDASWHPDAPVIAATSWNGWGTSLGTCSVHSWNDGAEGVEEERDGIAEMGQAKRVNAQLEEEQALYGAVGRGDFFARRSARRGFLGTRYVVPGDEDEDE